MGVLRLFLAISVLATHLRYGRGILGCSFLSGPLAVECFFIISGFYMALVLTEKYNYRGSYWTFIQQRFLRLFPLYFIVLLLILLVDAAVTWLSAHPYGVYQVWSTQPRQVTFLSVCYYVLVNLSMLGIDTLWLFQQDSITGQLYLSPYPMPGTNRCVEYIVNTPTWTLGVEAAFYVMAPFLVRKSVALQASVLLASLAFRSYFYWIMPPEGSIHWTYYFGPSDLMFFMAGSIGYHYYKKYRPQFEAFAIKYSWTFWVFGILSLIEGRTFFKDYFFWFFLPAAMIMVPLLFAYTRNNKRDRLIGELSYPFYLFHSSVVLGVEAILHEKYRPIFGPLCVLITFVLAYYSYRWIELGTEHYREGLFRRAQAKLAQDAKISPESPSLFPAAPGPER
jgi:peptidoglycan/LPS O-acetylase OafA/YrhL